MILYHQWLSLPLSTRIKIAETFGIEKKGATEVFNNTVKNDGYLIQDVETALNVEALQKFLNSVNTDISLLWVDMVYRIEHPEVKLMGTFEGIEELPVESVAPKKKVIKRKK